VHLSYRSPIILYLPIPQNIIELDPARVIIRLPNEKNIDVGALCYIRREHSSEVKNPLSQKHRGRRVDLESLDEKRKDTIKKIIFHISDEILHSGRRIETIRDHATRFVAFMYWADTNNHLNVLFDINDAKKALRAYSEHLKERVKIQSLTINSASRQQASIIIFLEEFFSSENIAKGLYLLRVNQSSKKNTPLPEDNNKKQVISLCVALFNEISDFLLNKSPYPHGLNVPDFINFPSNKIWIFPTTSWFTANNNATSGHKAYIYSEGRLATAKELYKQDVNPRENKSYYYCTANKAKYQIHKANNDSHNIHRLHQGMNALNFFIILFLAQTGMNWSQLINLTWSDDYEIGSKNQLFRTIKWRANNKEVNFEIPSSFLPKFKKYLELRKYLLQNHESKWLFFSRGCKRNSEPIQIKCGLSHTYKTLKKIYPPLVSITSRQWRAAKSDWLIRHTDPSTTALVLQNSERTVLASYASGSETSQINEISKFLDAISKTAMPKGYVVEDGTERPIGICSKLGAPRQLTAQAAIASDCKNTEGCLFCDKFRVHADEKDTRKLLSCKYCIQQTEKLYDSEESISEKLEPVITRIDDIVDEISKLDKNLVTRVTKEVEERGELDPYWSLKLEMLMELGLV